MSLPYLSSQVRLVAALVLLAPALFFGLQGARTYAAAPAATAPLAGSASANSRYGPISVTFSGSGSTLSLSVTVGKQFFTFTVPARDLTQNATTATLDTHTDLKGYGSLHLVWDKRTTHVPAGKGGCGLKPTPAHNQVTLVNGRGTATLHLPCLAALGLHFGGTVKFPKPSTPIPGIGTYQGMIATLSFTLPNNSSLSLTLHQGSGSAKKVDLSGFASRTYLPTDSAAPLQSTSQSFHAGVPASKVRFQTDLSAGSLTFGTGPKLLRGTSVQLSPLSAAIAVKGTPADSCHPATKGGGASRTMKLQGSLSAHMCAVSGAFTVDPTRSFGSLYSSSLTVQPPTPLKVVSVTPADKATNVATTLQAITVTFSNAMSDQYGSATLTGGTDFQYIQKGTLDSTKKTITFPLTHALHANTSYKLTISAIDQFQQPITSNTTFTTGT
jgi:hypothetical protein